MQARSLPLLPRDRLWQLACTALPTPIADVCASIDHQIDDVGKLSRVIDAAHVTIQLLATLVVASRLANKVAACPEGAERDCLARPSFGHWLQILREGTRGKPDGLIPGVVSVHFDCN